jgi:2,4-dienoyl-CoA reductase-like NADH-dependent reductase (Old Yellow Enzyme family)/thioredoxin reductase
MTQQYEHILRPIAIGSVEIPNRVVRTAHATGLTLGDDKRSDFVAYHAAAAGGGVGLTIIEAAAVHPTTQGRLRFENDLQMPEYSRALRDLRKYPMRLFQQLVHTGRAFMTPGGDPPWSASPIPSPRITHSELSQTPLAITQTQIDEVVNCFATAAGLVVEAGIDGVEINAAHGYFIAQFMSPHTNKRDDAYGGSRENRVRILLEILSAARRAIGAAIPLGVRLSADEVYPGGITAAEAGAIVELVNQSGLVDFVNVSLGSPMNVTKVIGGMEEPLGYELPYSAPVAKHADVPTIVAGRITSLEQADELVRTGVADLVAMTRSHIADPELVLKSTSGSARRVRPCIGCNQGCIGAASSPYSRFGCTVNPSAGFESVELDILARPHQPQRVLVIGGGPAGLEAARSAALQGDQVVLCEAGPALGGQLIVAQAAPTRERMGDFANWLAAEVQELGVDIRLDTTVTADLARNFESDRVIVATGSRPRNDGFTIADPDHPVRGLELAHVVSSWDAITDDSLADRRAFVYDDVGHHEAVSVAEALLARGCEVTFVTRLDRLMPLLEHARMETTVKQRLFSGPFEFIADAKVVEIRPDEVLIRSLYGTRDRAVPADLVVLVGSNVPMRGLADELNGTHDVTIVGDALGPRFLQLALLEGRRAAVAPELLPTTAYRF